MSRNIIKNMQNLERYMCIILQTILLRFTGRAIQGGILKEELSSMLLMAPIVHWHGVLIDILEGPRVLTTADDKMF